MEPTFAAYPYYRSLVSTISNPNCLGEVSTFLVAWWHKLCTTSTGKRKLMARTLGCTEHNVLLTRYIRPLPGRVAITTLMWTTSGGKGSCCAYVDRGCRSSVGTLLYPASVNEVGARGSLRKASKALTHVGSR